MDNEEEVREIRKELDAIKRRMAGGPFTKEEIRKKLEAAKAWIAIIGESQATREKYSQKLAIDFQLEGANDLASTRVLVNELEKSVYGGGVLGALRKRIENVERAFLETQEGTGSSGHE